VDPALCGDVLLQEFHLVRENSAVGQNQEFSAVWDIGCIQQLHVRFFQQPITLAFITATALSPPEVEY
jgi:hypothetical protein